MKRTEDGYKLTSGRKIYAHNGIIGINPEMEVFEGYDGTLHPCIEHLSAEERREVCVFMIELWTTLRDQK